MPLETFNSLDAQTKYFEENTEWTQHDSRTDDSVVKVRFYCNFLSRRKGSKCPAQLELHLVSDDQRILNGNGQEHVHDAEESVHAKKPLTRAVKQKIDRLIALKVAPRLIYHQLHQDASVRAADKPTYNQVSLSGFFLFV